MLASFVITFRETLEAALIIGIILAYLLKTHGKKYFPLVYSGVGAAIAASVISAFAFNYFLGGFSGRAEEIFEGIVMIFASGLITYMILWMLKQKNVVAELRAKIDHKIHEEHKLGLFFLVFVSVFREGIETVIFLGAASTATSASDTLIGGAVGIVVATILGYLIYKGIGKFNLKKFFNITSVILVLFAAGLFAHGIHELQEAQVVPTVIEHVWDLNPAVMVEGEYPALHEKGIVGSIGKSLFGYNGNPSLIEVLSYLFYLLVVYGLYRNIKKLDKFI